MSEYRVAADQQREIEAGLAGRIAANNVNFHAAMQQSINRSEVNARISGSSSQQIGVSNVAEQIQMVLSSGRGLAELLYNNFEDVMDDFKENVQEVWIQFRGLSPWQKTVAIFAIFAIIFLIGAVGYFSWKFVCYIWPKIVEFATEYGPKIAAEGVKVLTSIENSEMYKQFCTSLQNNYNNLDLSGWEALLPLGMPCMLALYKSFFHFLSITP